MPCEGIVWGWAELWCLSGLAPGWLWVSDRWLAPRRTALGCLRGGHLAIRLPSHVSATLEGGQRGGFAEGSMQPGAAALMCPRITPTGVFCNTSQLQHCNACY